MPEQTELTLLRADAADLSRSLFLVRQRSEYRRWKAGPQKELLASVDAMIAGGNLPQLEANIDDLLKVTEEK